MTAIDKATGLPILGHKSPEQEMQEYIDRVHAEKQTLAPDDHDWVVIAAYHLCQVDADRALTAQKTGVPCQPPIPLITPLIRSEPVGPVCHRCNAHIAAVGHLACPGRPLEEYIASLPMDEQVAMIASINERLGVEQVPS